MTASTQMMYTHEEAGPEWAGLPHAWRGCEGQAGEAECQDHGTQAQVTQAQVKEETRPAPARDSPSAPRYGPGPRG